MSFRASYDTTTKVISAAVFILFLVIAAGTHSVISEGIFALIFLASYAWSPTGYSVVDGDVVIKRLIGNVHIPVAGIREVRMATRDDLRGSMRVFGSGGLFGYYGLFRNSKLGESRWYVTDRSHSLVLVSDSGTAIVSPDDSAAFIAALGKPSTPQSALPVEVSRGSLVWLKVAAPIVIGVAGLAVGVMALSYSPGPPALTLTKNSLAIHDRFYPVTLNAASIDVSNVRLIDFDKDSGWQPVERTDGFGNNHYHSGWFRLSSGQKVRMYRADGTRVVLLPPKGNGTAVLLEAKEPDQFLAELRRQWGDEQPSPTSN